MPTETTGADLLEIAEHVLQNVIVPKLAPDQRATGLMIASAMRMVAREIAQTHVLAAMETAVASLLCEGSSNCDWNAIQELRSGAFDADVRLHLALWADAAARTSVSRPSFLSRAERQLAQIDDRADADQIGFN